MLGLVGQTTGQAIVIEKLEEAGMLDFSKSIRLYSQTTKSLDEFQKIVEYIKEHISPDVTFEYYDTICRQVANRIPNIKEVRRLARPGIFCQRQEKLQRKNPVQRM